MKSIINKKSKSTAIGVVGIIILAIALIVLVQPRPRDVREAYGSYSLNAGMSLVDQLHNSTLYGNNTTLTDPSVIYNSISKDVLIDVNVNYFNSQGSSEQIYYSYSVYVISSSPSWEKLSYSTDKVFSATSSFSYSFVMRINLTSNVSLGSEINDQLGFTSGSSYSINIISQAKSDLGSSDSNLTIAIGGATDSVSGPGDAPVTGSYFKNAVIPGKIIIPLSRDTSYPLIIIAAILLGYSAFLVMPSKPDPVQRFRRDNRENLIELGVGPPDGSIPVRSTDDLFRMATFVERPVFIFEDIVFIEIDGKTYYAEIKK
ncbi:MAG: hypothetical protein M1431_00440 [Candidatus Thermoplasmatota archaeon]|nr:hypothetical protein [Candidatus Thermoplasmatota archaeon]